MKIKPTLRPFLAAIGGPIIAISSASAQDGTWNQTAVGTYLWDTAGNWLSDIIANGTDNTATFGNLSGAQTVTIDTARTIGNIGYTGTNNFLLTIGGDETLTMELTTGTPTIHTATRNIDITSGLAGTQGLLRTGNSANAGTLRFLTTAPTFTGGLTLNGGNTALAVAMTSIGGNGSTITATGNSQLEMQSGHATILNNNLHINDGVTFTQRRGQPNTTTLTGVVSGGDTTTLRVTDAGTIFQRTLFLNNTANTFTGAIDLTQNRSSIIVGSLPDSEGAGNISFGGNDGGFALSTTADAPMVITNRQFVMTGGNGTVRIENQNTNADNTLIINSDLSVSGDTGTKTLRLGGGNIGVNTFGGAIGNAFATFNLQKGDAGTWHLDGTNAYNGTTTVLAGTLLINGDQSAAAGDVFVNGTSTLGGSGTIGGTVIVAAGGKIAPGTTVGTLTLNGGLDLSAMAGGAGKLNYDLGPIAASDKMIVGSTLTIGDGLLGFSDFDFSAVGGLEEGVYTLITSGGISGSLDAGDLQVAIGSSDVTLQLNGNNIELVVVGPKPTTTLVIDLGTGTQVPGGAFGTFGALNLPIPPLPAGSILRSLEIDAVLQATDNENFASDLAVLFDPTPVTPGDFSVVMTNGTIKFGAPVQLGWPATTDSGPSLVDTKVVANWAGAGTIDLATTGIFLGNAFNNNIGSPAEGGTWSGTITLTYDSEPTGTPFDLWAGPGAVFGGDANGDGVSNGLAFLLGADSPNDDARGLLPTVTETGGGLIMAFSMLNATARGGSSLKLEHSSDLGLADDWTTVLVPENSGGPTSGVTFTVTPNGSLNDVVATISSTEAADGKLFGRLSGTE